ncbi:TIGR03621 family F420-dependent LLM class oxidoreductase [Sphaerisporangium sp. TRM90804]|uniref:TIGR03621 family F420-dependent LLM class oxidoreductase n=1 Tax=Sphaerisporangium sp. TRM90804 TaxID=3031113 RepID=UPI00244A7F09|nr:TIGR03621 family F420-dependent LLM class oxidoreductase [Sphaerisporangium sp. TRM90804]MDH2424679.1 TIGR03621 family F420-dependent LLM class oxidoreductase [Sphaerisporangium sp. TRM90804]
MRRPFRFAAVIREAESAKSWADQARRLEDSGFEVLLVPDHLVGARFAPVAALAAAACATSRLRVGTLVFANDFRHPAVLAKEAATLDVLSEGRLEFGVGTGWMASDYASAGLPLETPRVRVARLAEAITVLRGLWSDGPFTFEGEHYRVTELDQWPKPVQRPGPRLTVGGGGPRLLELGAREADVLNITTRVLPDGSGPDPADSAPGAFLAKLAAVREAAGDRYDTLELGTTIMHLGVREPGAPAAADTRDDTPQVLLGTRRDVVDRLLRWRDDHDVSYYVLHDEPDLDAFTPIVEELAGR